MRYSTTKDFEKRQDYFVCANYRKIADKCSAHYIRAVVLEEMVWRHMQMVISYVAAHEAHFRAVMGDKLKLASDEAIRVSKRKLAKAEKRLGELNRIFMRLYEDRVNGTISDDVERFIAQTHKYVGLENLTPYALHELVKAIYIEAPDESSGKRRQNIHISYNFVGFIPIHELMQEEMA